MMRTLESPRSAVTVILPVHNGEPTLERAIRSTLRALPGDGRLMVHDDASSDRTPRILADIDDRRLEVVRSDEPQGVARGLNLLLCRVDTPLVARMDADDLSFPWRFRYQVGAVHRGADVVFSTVVAIGDVPGRIRPGPPLGISPEAMPLHLLLSNPVAHSSMLARTETLQSAGGYRELSAEDYELWLRLTGTGSRCVRLPWPSILYRFHAKQVTAATGWSASSLSDPQLIAAYSALSVQCLGREADWYQALTTQGTPSAAEAAQLSAFAAEMRASALRLPRWQRTVLMRKISAVAALARTADSAPAPDRR